MLELKGDAMGIYKRGRQWYCSIVDPNGRLIRKPLSADKRVAERIFAKLREQFELQKAGVLPKDIPEAQKAKPLNVIRREFLDKMKVKGRTGRYFDSFDSAWRRVFDSAGVKTINEITWAVLEAWIQEQKRRGNKGQSINQVVFTLRPFIQWVIDEGYLNKNPWSAWEPLKDDDKVFRRDLTTEEVRLIFETEKNAEDRLRWLVYFSTGLRNTAGTLLAWEWVDWNERVLVLPVAANKSRRINRIPMHNGLYEALKTHHDACGNPTSGLVFTRIGSRLLLARFRAVCEKAGINLDGVCMHSVRHTVATMLYEAAGKNLKAVQEVLGHSSISTTAIYLHVDDELKRSALEKLDLNIG